MNPAAMGRMWRQLQRLQEDMARLQAELGERTVEATAGGGAVRAVADGRLQLRALQIDPAAVDPADVEMLQDLVLAAVNECLRKAQEMVQSEMGRLTGGLGLPGLPG